MTPKKASQPSDVSVPEALNVVDLEHYAPAYLTWIANKLSRGASQCYLDIFDVGIETWRCLVLLAIDGSISAQKVSRVIGMDKGSVSRCFKSMQTRGLVRMELDESDGRLRIAVLTAEGRALHGQILGIALERERAFLSVLKPGEADLLLDMLQRLHENLPAVEVATQDYAQRHFPKTKVSRSRAVNRQDD